VALALVGIPVFGICCGHVVEAFHFVFDFLRARVKEVARWTKTDPDGSIIQSWRTFQFLTGAACLIPFSGYSAYIYGNIFDIDGFWEWLHFIFITYSTIDRLCLALSLPLCTKMPT